MIASLLGIGLAAAGTAQPYRAEFPSGVERVRYAQLSVHSRVIIRVRSDAVPAPVEIVEKKGPKCLPLGSVAGAAVIKPDSVDFILRGGQRMRARFSSRCPALDYYSGFYIVPHPDGQVCADRDVIRSRAGGECPIDRMRTLVVHAKKH